jgi:hypothetical protein
VPVAAPAPRHDLAMLCLLALRDEEARRFLEEQNWRDVIRQTPGAELLARILESKARPNEPASLNAFMSTLAPEDEALVSSWLLQKKPENAAIVARDWWIGLRQASLRRQLEAAQSRLKPAQLPPGEILHLQKEIVDLQEQLRELPKLSPDRVA